LVDRHPTPTRRSSDLFKPGNHGSTFGGNPLACVCALTTLDIIEEERLVERAAQLGLRMLARLEQRLAGVPGVKQVRGKGLLLGRSEEHTSELQSRENI